ncbi:MAG TPA: SDR family NAD(P)-dependent oxidoreductase [Dehalococcoidia bacterium]|nr:SDR family NAD(P)-dependent oxidoreductase [Dehalococcoidia bacterium]
MATKHLDGKVAIITGAAGGIGRGVCDAFSAQGARLVVTDTGGDVEGRSGIDSARVDAVAGRVQTAGGEAVAVAGDIADLAVAEQVVRTALDTYGKLDTLICTHGILRERMIFNMTEDEWDEVVRVHLKGCFAPTKFASIYWRQSQTGGSIIYVTSDAGIVGGAGQPNYSAAHAGKLGLMRSNALALKKYGVTCNAIAPSASTRMTDRGRMVDRAAPAPSLGAAGTARDPAAIAPIAVWLASDDASEVSGRIFGAGGHRISVYRDPVQERVLMGRSPMFDIDWLFQHWDDTLGQDRLFPEPIRQLGAPPSTPSTPSPKPST